MAPRSIARLCGQCTLAAAQRLRFEVQVFGSDPFEAIGRWVWR